MLLIILTLGFMLLSEAAALSCYSCNTTDTITTNDNCTMAGAKVQTCPPTLLFITWSCITIKDKGVVLEKGCVPGMLCSLVTALHPDPPDCCESDKCNGATKSSASILLFLAPLVSVAGLF